MASLGSGVTVQGPRLCPATIHYRAALRRPIVIVTNGTLRARNPAIWGDGTTACASDSKHFGAWDQNLHAMARSLRRARRDDLLARRRKFACIHSQLKSPSSSEVASMIEGVLRHCTEMEVDRQYVDSHGQSTVGFAFLPVARLPALAAPQGDRSRTLRAGAGHPTPTRTCGRPDQADRLGTDSPAIRPDGEIRDGAPPRHRRDRSDPAPLHPQTTFSTRPTRRSPNSAAPSRRSSLPVPSQRGAAPRNQRRAQHRRAMERRNDFLFFARRGECASNRREDQEISMLRCISSRTAWSTSTPSCCRRSWPSPIGRETDRQRSRALTPLIWEHVNPYGRFELDMDARLPLL